MSTLYHIRRDQDAGDYSQGYIGVTDDLDNRISQHKSGGTNGLVKTAYDRYDDISIKAIENGDRIAMLSKERSLRPRPNMGWNLDPGGRDTVSDLVKKAIRELTAAGWHRLDIAEVLQISERSVRRHRYESTV